MFLACPVSRKTIIKQSVAGLGKIYTSDADYIFFKIRFRMEIQKQYRFIRRK